MSDRLFPDRLEFVASSEVLKASGFDFVDSIPTSDSLKAIDCAVTAKDNDGVDASSIVSGKKISGTNLTADLGGFVDGKNYLVTYKAVFTTSAGVAEKYLLIKVRNMSAVA